MKTNYLTKTDDYIKPFLDKNGFTLIKSEFVEEEHNWYLRLYIDLTEEEINKRKEKHEAEKEAKADDITGIEDSALVNNSIGEDDLKTDEYMPGIDINDCAKVSRYLGKWLDKEDFIKEAYTLEVCSKGFLNSSNAEDND